MKDYIPLLNPSILSGAEIIPCLCPSGQGDNQYNWGLLIAIQNTTLGRLLERFEFKNEGTIRYEGEDVGIALHFPDFSFPAEDEFENLRSGELPVLKKYQFQVAVTNTDLGIMGFNLTGRLTLTKGPPIGFKLELQFLVREYDLRSIPGRPALKGSWPSLTLLAEEGDAKPVLNLQLKDVGATNGGDPVPLFGDITVTTNNKDFSLQIKSTPSLTLTGSQLSSSLVAAAGALTLCASGAFKAELKKDEFALVVPKGKLELTAWLLRPFNKDTLINVSSTKPLSASLEFDANSFPDQKGLHIVLHRNPEQSTFELPENIKFQPSGIELELPGFASSLGTLAESGKNQFSFVLKPIKGYGFSPTEGWDLDKKGNVTALADVSVNLGEETLQLGLEFRLNLFTGALEPKGSLHLRKKTQWNLELFHLSLESEDPRAKIGELSWEKRLLILNAGAKGKLKFPGGAGAEATETKNRFELALQKVPKKFASESEPEMLLGLSPAGITLYAQITGSQVEILDADGGLSDDQQRCLTPLPKSGDTKSEILIVNNQIVAARIFAHGTLVGFKDMGMNAELCLRQKDPQSVPDVVATLSLDRSSGKPLGQLNVPFLHMQLDDLRLNLEWLQASHKWQVQAFADGCMRLAPEYQPERLGGLQKNDAIAIKNQDMMDLAKDFSKINKFTLNLARPIELEVLDGMFGCTLHSLDLTKTGSKIELSCTKAEFRFKNEGVLEIDIQAGGIHLEVDTNKSAVRLAFPSRLGLEVRVKDGVQFRGEVGWEMDQKAGKKVFMAAGQLLIPGLPEGSATLTLGTGIKQDGSLVPNVSIYAQVGFDVPLFAGVVIKQLGAGVGLNRRLVALGDEPTPEQLLANLDRLKPEQPDSWEFVPEGDFYVSLVGTVILASNSGGDTIRNSYVAWLLVSIDTNADIVAAGKLWLTCSAKYARDNFDRPVLAGALALLPRKKTLRAVLTSLPNPAIPEKALAEIFSRLRVRISFYMSPDVVDYFLEEFSYTAELYRGVVAQIRATQRTSILEGTAFVKERIDAMARLEEELRCGPGGVSFQGNFALRLEWGGLLNLEGFVLLGSISVHLGFQISAWLEIGFSKSFKFFGKKITISWSKIFRLANTHLEIGLAGAIAAVNGTLGFSGKVLVSISICGHQLALSPSFAINNSAIEAARARMAGFEQRLNRLTGREANAVELANSTPATEFWLAFKLPDNSGFLYFPSSSSRWLCEYFTVVGEGETEKVVLFQGAITYLLPGSHTAEELKKNAAEIGFPLVITAAMQSADSPNAEVQTRALLLEATPQDEALPPNEWLKVESLVQDPRVRSESRAWWTTRDRFLLPDYVLPCDFRSFEEVEASGEAGNEIEAVSLFEHGLRRSRRLSLHDHSDFDPANEVFTARVQILRDLLQAARKAAQTGTPTHHVLRNLVKDSLEHKVSFIRSSQLTLDDNPPVEDLEEAHVVVAHPDPEWICLAPIRQKAALKREVIDNKIVENGTVLVKLPIFLEDGNVEQQFSQIGTFEIYRRMPWESRFSKIAADVFPQLRSYTLKSQDPSRETTTDVRRLLLIPYLFTDTFEVHDGKFVTPGLDSKSEIEYALRHIPPLGVREDEGIHPNPSRIWPTVRLHIPDSRAQDDLRDFAATISVPELFLDTEQRALKFARLQPKEGQPPGSSSPVLIPKLEIAVEVWAQEMPMTQSGFYVGVDEGAVEPERLAIEEPMESVEGKFLAGVAKAGDPGVMLNTSSFRSGYSYKLYLRPQVAGVRNPEFLRRLPILMTRTKVAEIHKETPLEKFRQAETLEWMPKDLHQEPRKRRLEDYLSLLHFRVNVVYPETASGEGVPAMLAIDWTSADRSMGGAEIVIEDWDDSSQSYRLVREVQERSVFQESQGDFSQSSRWELVRGQQTVSLYNPDDSVSTTDGERTAFYVQPTLPVEKAVTDAAAEVKNALGQEKWLEVNRRVSKLWKELATYQTSIYQRNSVALQQNFALVRLLLQYYLMGLRAPTNLVLTDIAALTPLQQGWEDLLERMTDIERTSYEFVRVPDAQDSVARQEDLKRAKQVVALLRYRQTCVAEMLTDEDEDVPFPPAEGEFLPAAKIFQKLFSGTPEKNSRVSWFFDHLVKGFDVSEPWPPSDWTILPALEDRLNKLGTVLQAEHLALASFVPRAVHLDRFLRKLKSKLESRTSSLRLRPHHVAATQSNEKGERLVMPTPVAEIIPPSDNQPEHAAAYLFNLFEKLGFASDVVCRNPNQLPIEPAELSMALAATRDEMNRDAMNDVKVTCFAVGAWENRGENLIRSDQNTPFSFIKVAVVPNLFLDALSGKFDHASDWFVFRGLTGLNETTFDKLKIQWKQICSQAEMLNGLNGFPFFHLQTRGWRWLTLAAESGRAYTFWALPNRLGHRYRVSIRALSRYEELLRWSEGETQPGVPADAPWRRVDVRRRMLNSEKDGNTYYNAPLAVFAHTHPKLIQFSYVLSNEGTRAILNGLSSVRTGFRGADLRFEYKPKEGKVPLETILAKIVTVDFDDPNTPTTVKKSDEMSAPAGDILLFRGERLITLADLPYCYRYGLHARPLYDADGFEPDRNFSPKLSEREPTFVASRPWQISSRAIDPEDPKDSDGPTMMLTARVYLTQQKDMFTAEEQLSSPPPLRVGMWGVPDLPDFALSYHLLRLISPSRNRTGASQVYREIAMVALPHHGSYGDPPKDSLGLAQIRPGELAKSPATTFYLPVHFNHATGQFHLDIQVELHNSFELNELFLLVARGSLSVGPEKAWLEGGM